MDSRSALLCLICPNTPYFSDLSHLLTHVSSKAHLSNYFKLQVRSHQDLEAGELLDEYNRWYKRNHMASLLSDRLSSKEDRHRKRQVKAEAQGGTYCIGESTRRSRRSQSNTYATAAARGLSPMMPICKIEDYDDGDSQEETVSGLHAATHWLCERDPIVKVEIDPRLSLSDPLDNRVNEHFESNSSHTPGGTDKENIRGNEDEMLKLKGILWPGMDLFDAATEHMRSKRNQRKDKRAFQMMQKASLEVDPTELVYSPSGILRKQREINGEIEVSSPLKGESPVLKRRSLGSKRQLFAESDPNIPVLRRRQEMKRIKSEPGPNSPCKPAEQPRRRSSRSGARGTANHVPLGNRGDPANADHEDFELNCKGFGKKSRGKFSVFQDEQPQEKYPLECLGQDHQSPSFESTISSQQKLPPPDSAPRFGYLRSSNHPLNVPGKSVGCSVGKENVDPLLTNQGRIQPSPFRRFNIYDDDKGLPPHYFFGDAPLHRPFGPMNGHSLSNPLAISLSRLPALENSHLLEANASPSCDPKSLTREISPDGTISDPELEDDKFKPLYMGDLSY